MKTVERFFRCLTLLSVRTIDADAKLNCQRVDEFMTHDKGDADS